MATRRACSLHQRRRSLSAAWVGVIAANLIMPATAEEPPSGYVIGVSKTIEGCVFSFPIGLISGLGGLSEASLPTSWSGSCVSGLISGQGVLRGARDSQEVFSYTGAAVAGAPDGHATISRADGFTLFATFHAGSLMGPVIVSGRHGYRYEGEWGDRGPEGYGALIQADGGRYTGEWHEGLRNGYGVFVWPSGSRYEGNWAHGARSGHGLLVGASGNRYDGDFANGKRNGHGTYNFANGLRVEAEWVDDVAVGPVSATAPNGARYYGGFRDGGQEGYGVATEANGDRYAGEWHDALPNGAGTLTRADGSEFSGQWTYGCLASGGRRAAFHTDPTSCGGTDHGKQP